MRCLNSPIRSSRLLQCTAVRCYSQEMVRPFTAKEKLVTHTGQEWSADDQRQARFDSFGRDKLVNEKFAIDLIKETPPIEVAGNIAVCDGGKDVGLGHPRIFINLDKPGDI